MKFSETIQVFSFHQKLSGHRAAFLMAVPGTVPSEATVATSCYPDIAAFPDGDEERSLSTFPLKEGKWDVDFAYTGSSPVLCDLPGPSSRWRWDHWDDLWLDEWDEEFSDTVSADVFRKSPGRERGQGAESG